jgi:hypothetical protein
MKLSCRKRHETKKRAVSGLGPSADRCRNPASSGTNTLLEDQRPTRDRSEQGTEREGLLAASAGPIVRPRGQFPEGRTWRDWRRRFRPRPRRERSSLSAETTYFAFTVISTTGDQSRCHTDGEPSRLRDRGAI